MMSAVLNSNRPCQEEFLPSEGGFGCCIGYLKGHEESGCLTPQSNLNQPHYLPHSL